MLEEPESEVRFFHSPPNFSLKPLTQAQHKGDLLADKVVIHFIGFIFLSGKSYMYLLRPALDVMIVNPNPKVGLEFLLGKRDTYGLHYF